MPKTVVKRQKVAVKVVRPPRNIGVDVPPPKEFCEDPNCPFHGTLPVRGQTMDVIVVSDKMQKSAVVKREYFHPIKKYERLEKRTSKFMVHSPTCVGAASGDKVKIIECRPLSKTKSFVIIQRL
ncbi:MAG: 30S ribosomal protein S17 [Deltaproteobacteria bacterium]|nr:30S ribosomal protein S17 [Deltaproteobacteria bacterium]